MELAGLKIVVEWDMSAVVAGASQTNTVVQQLANTIKSAFNAIPDFKSKFNYSSNGASQAAQDAREYARAAREQAAADLDAAKAADIAARAEDRKNKKDREAKDLYGQLVADNQALVREYYNAAAAQIKFGEASGITATKLEELRTKAKAGQDQLASIEAGAGRFQRNVGNYASGFNPLNNSINQLTREFPAFTNSFQTGFLGISNNIAPIADALQQIKRETALARVEAQKLSAAKYAAAEAAALDAGATAAEAKAEAKLAGALAVATPQQVEAAAAARLAAEAAALQAGATQSAAKAAGALAGAQAVANTQGASTPGVFAKLTGAIFSWQTALSIGITLLTVYGPKIAEWIKGMSSGTDAAKRAAEAQKAYDEATKSATETATKSVAQEQVNAEVLYRATQNLSLSMAERLNAAKNLIAIAPHTFASLNEEAVVAGKAAGAYKVLIGAIKDKIALEVGQEQAKQLLIESQAADKASKTMRAATGIYDNFKTELDNVHKELQKGTIVGSAYDKKVNDIINTYNVARANFAKQNGGTFPELSKKEQVAAIDAQISAAGRLEQKLTDLNQIRGKVDEIFKPIDKAKTEKDVRTATDAYDELVKKNKIADAELLAGSTNVAETLKKKISNYRSYIVELATTKLNFSLDSSEINNAFGEITKISTELSKLEAPKKLDDATFDGHQFIQLGNTIKAVATSVETDMKRYDKAFQDGLQAQRLQKYKDALETIFGDINKMIADTLAETTVLIAEGIGNIIAGTGNLGNLFKSIGQFLGDQIIAFGKQLIAAGGLMQTAQAAIKALSITPVLAILAGGAAVALGEALKAALSKSSRNVGRAPFAAGGVVYGPTNALVGEYSGARGNPEVIAPLDKLTSILRNQNIGGSGDPILIIPSVTLKGSDMLLTFERAKKAKNR